VRKNAPIIGSTINEAAFHMKFGVIVVGAELSGKSTSHKELGELVLGPKDLLVFTARELDTVKTLRPLNPLCPKSGLFMAQGH
jgi:hypothetical protein